MGFPLTKDMLRAMINNNPASDEWFEALEEIMPKYGIDTPNRIAGFIAQCAHESADFKRLEENLNYSDKALNAVFGRYFGAGKNKRNADDYARKPEKIANYVYQDKYRTKRGAMGNLNDGDGWLFRGRGLKQLTGRNNYTAFGKTVDMSAEEAVDYVATAKGAVESACWFWDTAKLNAIADAGDIVKMTKKINGGTIGLEDRTQRWNKALGMLGGEIAPAPKKAKATGNTNVTLSVGSRGDDVKAMQAALGLNADGVFGSATKRAVEKWQKANGLVADGIAGPASLGKLYG